MKPYLIAIEHTPNNIMIRAERQERSPSARQVLEEQYAEFRDFWRISPYLERALGERGLGLTIHNA